MKNTKRTAAQPSTKRSAADVTNARHERAIATMAKPSAATTVGPITVGMLTGAGDGVRVAVGDVPFDRDREIATLIAVLGIERRATFYKADGGFVVTTDDGAAASFVALLEVWLTPDGPGRLLGWRALGSDWRIVDTARARLIEHHGAILAVLEAPHQIDSWSHRGDTCWHAHELMTPYEDEQGGVPTVSEVHAAAGVKS